MANGGAVVSRPAVPPPVRIRQNIKKLSPTDPIVLFYGKAVGAMKAKAFKDPLSWRYQAAIHDYVFPASLKEADLNLALEKTNDEIADPATRPSGFPKGADPPPDASDRSTYWRKCQHGSWFFLPWHRMYLHHFERIIMAQVAILGGPKDWALPYWDWTATDGDGKIPVALRNSKLADGTENHLFVLQRNTDPGSDANKGDRIASDKQMDKAFSCLLPTKFEGDGEFGGPAVRQHGGEGPPESIPPALNGLGKLEGTPHGSMHVATGGGSGWMSAFTQAALDPIFWLHHCNIDRLWEVWIQRDKANKNPSDVAWLDAGGKPFKFHDSTGGTAGDLTPRQVLQSRVAPLLYEYDDTSDPLKKKP
jgi:tyrosinase